MPTADSAHRTFICSVLFLDMVEYSKRTVSEQIRLKELFNAALSQAIRSVAASDRIILDTGDGAAVSFLGDPEDAMFVALDMRDAIAAAGGRDSLQVRFGINLGPVRLVKDLNGQPNIIGDGINVAQRVMSFAAPGQILVSRSYFEVIARLSEDYAGMFQYQGARTDKHVREHEVYAVTGPARRQRAAAPRSAQSAAVARLDPRALAERWDVHPQLLWIAPLCFALILAGGVAARSFRLAEERVPVAPPLAQLPAPAPAPQEPPKEAPVQEKAKALVAEDKPRAHPAEEKKSRLAETRAGAPERAPKPAAKTAAAAQALEPAAVAQAPVQGTLTVTALPWAEVIVDGKSYGVSPPLRNVSLPAGRHRVELKNSAFPPYDQTVEISGGQQVNIRHRFKQ